MPFAKIEDAVAAFARGEILVVVDDEDRENEGDLIQAAEFATPESIAFFLHHTSGYLCAPITAERASELDLPPMVVQNTESQRTAFLVTVDYRHDTSTGISAYDRCATVQALCNPETRPGDLARPGHINPLMAREVTGPRRRLDERLDRQRAVAGGDARRGAVPVVDGVGERRAVRLGVVLDHEGQPELVASLAGQRHADDP